MLEFDQIDAKQKLEIKKPLLNKQGNNSRYKSLNIHINNV